MHCIIQQDLLGLRVIDEQSLMLSRSHNAFPFPANLLQPLKRRSLDID